MSLDLIAARRLIGVPLLAERSYAECVADVLADRIGAAPVAGVDRTRHMQAAREMTIERHTGICILPVVGALVHRSNYVSDSGQTGYIGLANRVTALANDPRVSAIILDLSSPGGECAGLTECCDAIEAARAIKPIWACVNSQACSAGYWLASSCDRIVAAPFSATGSIGVVTMHIDRSRETEKRGHVVTFIHAGKHKVAGHPFAPLPDDVRANIQAAVDAIYAQFVDAVAANRGLTADKVRATEAGVFSPQEALRLGLVDGIATLSETIVDLAAHLEGLREGVR